MNPQGPVGAPGSLPPAQAMPPSTVPPTGPVGTGVPGTPLGNPAAPDVPQSSEAVVAAAKALTARYGTNPYQLAGALQQLKGGYLAERFQVNVNQPHA